jgi:hypothetical protein
VTVGLGSRRKNDAAEKLIRLPAVENYDWRAQLAS